MQKKTEEPKSNYPILVHEERGLIAAHLGTVPPGWHLSRRRQQYFVVRGYRFLHHWEVDGENTNGAGIFAGGDTAGEQTDFEDDSGFPF